MITFQQGSADFVSVTEIIKYVETLLLFACLVFSRTFGNGIQLPGELF